MWLIKSISSHTDGFLGNRKASCGDELVGQRALKDKAQGMSFCIDNLTSWLARLAGIKISFTVTGRDPGWPKGGG